MGERHWNISGKRNFNDPQPQNLLSPAVVAGIIFMAALTHLTGNF